MLPVNFSATRPCVVFIERQITAEPKSQALKFVQNKVIPRIIGITLPCFALFDLLAHTFGAAHSACTSDFSNAKKHLKCAQTFAKILPILPWIGPKDIKEIDSNNTTSILLLSRDKTYSENLTVDSLQMITRVEKLSHKLPPEEKQGMEESLALLKSGKRILKELAVLDRQQFLNKPHLTPKLTAAVKALRKSDRNLFERIFLKESLSRVLALGLSITASLDLAIEIFTMTFTLLAFHLIRLLLGKHTQITCDLHKDYLLHLRNIASALVGTVSGSLTGVIHPDLGCKMSTITKKFDPSLERIQKKIFDEIANLEHNKSILIPISFVTGRDSRHIVYCLVTRQEEAYQVNILNKGWGAEHTNIMCNGKIPINYPVNRTSFKEVTAYLGDLLHFSTQSYHKVVRDGNNPEIRQIALQRLYPERLPYAPLLLGKFQVIGDCPRASLMAALYYHSAVVNKPFDPLPYKRFKRHLKDLVFENEGHLLDIALNLRDQKTLPSDYVREKHKKGWEKFDHLLCSHLTNHYS